METLMNMTLTQIFGSVVGIIAFISIFIEITPIKWNPVSSFMKWIGKRTNAEMMDKFDEIEKKVNDIQKLSDERDVISCRVRILAFGDEIRRGIKHSKEHFDQILSDIDNYERYCNEHPEFKNNKTVMTTKMIKKTYEDCMINNSFL